MSILESERYILFAKREQRFCRTCGNQEECPVDRIKDFAESNPSSSLSEIIYCSIRNGLVQANGLYGHALPEMVREEVGEVVFTADCVLGDIKGTNYTHCGSIIAKDSRNNPRLGESIAVKLIEAQWVLNR